MLLIVDDDESFREVAAAAIGMPFLLAESIPEGLALAREYGSAIDCVLLDLHFPGAGPDGIEAAPLFREALPVASIVLATMDDDLTHYHRADISLIYGYVIKDGLALVRRIVLNAVSSSRAAALMSRPDRIRGAVAKIAEAARKPQEQEVPVARPKRALLH